MRDLFLCDFLPQDGYEYMITSFNMINKSPVVGESQFNLTCRVNVTNEDDWKEWFAAFCSKTGTSYNKKKGDKKGTKKIIISGYRKCIHKVIKKKTCDAATKIVEPTSKKGPGRKKGEARVPMKQTDCEAEMKYIEIKVIFFNYFMVK